MDPWALRRHDLGNIPPSGGFVKRLVVLAAAMTVAATGGVSATALAAPSASGVTHRHVHVSATPSTAGVSGGPANRTKKKKAGLAERDDSRGLRPRGDARGVQPARVRHWHADDRDRRRLR